MASKTREKKGEDAAVTGSQEERAAEIIRRNVLWGTGAGVIPVAYVDTAALLAVQLKLLKELADVYEVPFMANVGKSAVAALLGSLSAGGASILATGLFGGLVRSVPVVGQLFAWATMPAFAAATTYAVGKVFAQHFASGGTFLTFDAKKVEAYFREKFNEAKSKGAATAAA